MKRFAAIEAISSLLFLIFYVSVGFQNPFVPIIMSYGLINIAWAIFSLLKAPFPKWEKHIIFRIPAYVISLLLAFFACKIILRFSFLRSVPLSKEEILELSLTLIAMFAILIIAYVSFSLRNSHQKLLIERKERFLLEKKLEALKRKFNPHFIFNALNSLAELIEISPKKAEKFCMDLANYYRKLLSLPDVWSMEEEIKFIKDYVQLISTVKSKDVKLEIVRDVETINFQIPAALLQPLIENAIKYARPCQNETPIKLRLRKKDDGTLIEISNPVDRHVKITPGEGIKITQERLKAIYPSGELSWKLENETVVFTLFLPAKENDRT